MKNVASGGGAYIYGTNLYVRTAAIGGSYTNAMLINSNQNVTIGASDLASTNYKFYVNGTSLFANDVTIAKTNGATITIRGTALNNAPGNILFRGGDQDSNGFKIEAEPKGSYGRVSLNFLTSNNTSGSAPYTPS